MILKYFRRLNLLCRLKNSDKKNASDGVKSYLDLFQYASLSEKILVILSIILAFFCGLLQPVLYHIYSRIISSILTYLKDIKHIENSHPIGKNDYLYGGLVIMGVLTMVLTYTSIFLINRVAIRQNIRIFHLFIQKVITQDVSWHNVHRSEEIVSNFPVNFIKFFEGINEKLIIFTTSLTSSIFGILLSFYLGWEFTLICLASWPISAILTAIIATIFACFVHGDESISDANEVAQEVLTNIKTVLAFEGQEKELLRYKKALKVFVKSSIIKASYKSICNGTLWFCCYGGYAFAFYFSIVLYINWHQYDLVTILTIFFCSMTAMTNLNQLMPIIDEFQLAKEAASDIYFVLKSESQMHPSKDKGLIPKYLNSKISFYDVCFSYPTHPTRYVLKALNFQINYEETVAIMGPPGSGKTTCLQLIQRLYDATSGIIYIGDDDIKDYNLNWLQNKISLASNEDPIFTDRSIAENIRLGRLSATNDQIVEIGKKVKLHEIVSQFPKAYQTILDEEEATGNFEMTPEVKIKIILARALLRKPEILLLDNITKDLDGDKETEIIDLFYGLCTTVIVSNKYSTIKHANRIIYLEAGVIIEEGTHDDLIESRGPYFNLMQEFSLRNGHESSDGELSDIDEEVEKSGKLFSKIQLKKSNIKDIVNQKIKTCEVPLTTFKIVLELVKCCYWMNIFPVLIGCLCSCVKGLIPVAFPFIYGHYLAILVKDNLSVDDFQHTFILFGVVAIFAGLMTFISMFSFNIVSENFAFKLREKLFQGILKQDLPFFDSRENSVDHLCKKLQDEVKLVQEIISLYLGTFINVSTTIIVAIFISIYLQWQITLSILVYAPLLFICNHCESRFTNCNILNENLERSCKSILEAVNNIQNISAWNSDNYFIDRSGKYLLETEKLLRSRQAKVAMFASFGRSLHYFVYGLGLGHILHLVVKKGASFEHTIQAFETVVFATVSISWAFSFLPNIKNSFESARGILKIIFQNPVVKHYVIASNKPWESGNIRFCNVTFAYPLRPYTSVLDAFNFQIRPGQSVAFVGAKGCGKSAILNLMERFYDPLLGEITVDKRDIRLMEMKVLRQQIGLVPQELFLFNRTIAQNIAYGAIKPRIVSQDIIEAAKWANLHGFVSSLPHGYDTFVGPNGVDLSEVEMLRIAIARALIRNPKVLLFDATFNYPIHDSVDKVIEDCIKHVKKSSTLVIATNRLNCLKNIDLICVLDNGNVVETGKHGELIKRRRHYFKLFKSQQSQQV